MPNTWDKQSNNPYVNAGNSIGQMIAMMAGGGENIRAKTKTKKTIFVTLITAFGAVKNENYFSLITNELLVTQFFK